MIPDTTCGKMGFFYSWRTPLNLGVMFVQPMKYLPLLREGDGGSDEGRLFISGSFGSNIYEPVIIRAKTVRLNMGGMEVRRMGSIGADLRSNIRQCKCTPGRLIVRQMYRRGSRCRMDLARLYTLLAFYTRYWLAHIAQNSEFWRMVSHFKPGPDASNPKSTLPFHSAVLSTEPRNTQSVC